MQGHVISNGGWMLAITAFPDWLPPFDVPEGWNDVSYRNDTCPHLELIGDNNVTCWLNYENESDRECGGKRFWIGYNIGSDDEDGLILSSDDVDKVKTMLTLMGETE